MLFENPGQGGSINHLGVEVDDVDAVTAWSTRVGTELETTDQAETTCCFATQEKFHVVDTPDRLEWEVYTVLRGLRDVRRRADRRGRRLLRELRPARSASTRHVRRE